MNRDIQEKGITLIALVITIIVLLILAGISIMMLVGQNGILNRASESGEITGRAQVIEIARVDIIDKQTQNGGEITEEELVEILTSDEYNTSGTLSDNGEETVLDKTLTTKDKKYEIPVREIWNGTFKEDNKIITFTIFGGKFSCEKGTKWIDWLRYMNSLDNCESSSWGNIKRDVAEALRFYKSGKRYVCLAYNSAQGDIGITLNGKLVLYEDMIVEGGDYWATEWAENLI